MIARVDTVWNRWSGAWDKPPTYRVVMDGVTLPTVYDSKAEAKAMADTYNMVAESNRHDRYSRAT